MSLADVILFALKTSIVLTVFALALRATLLDAFALIRRPSALVRPALAMNVVMPLVAIGLALIFDLHPAVKIAIVALSVSPMPPFLPRKALKSGGRENYVVGLLVAASLLAIVVNPIAIELCEHIFGVPLRGSVSSVVLTVVVTVLGPLAAGLLARHLFPTLAERVANQLSALAAGLLLASALPIVFRLGGAMLSLLGDGTLLTLVAFSVIGVLVGHGFGGPDDDDRRVLALATASRHPGVAIGIAQANFPEQTLAIAAIGLAVIVGVGVTGLYSTWHERHKLTTSVRPGRAC